MCVITYSVFFRTVKLPVRDPVCGMASWNTELYIAIYLSTDIDVYDTNTFTFLRKIPVSGTYFPYNIVAHANIIFIAEWDNALVRRIEMPHEFVSSWPVLGKCVHLSVTKNGHVVVAFFKISVIAEYTSIGTCLRKFKAHAFDTTICGPHHAIKLNQDRFLICHCETTYHRVCIIDSSGRPIRS